MVRTKNRYSTTTKTEKAVATLAGTGGCLGFLALICIWLFAILVQLAIWVTVAAGLFAGAYWLFTGEFYFATQ